MSTGTLGIQDYYNINDTDRMVLFFPEEERQSHVDDLLNRLKKILEDWITLAIDERNVPAAQDTIAARVTSRRRTDSQRKIKQ